MKTMKTIQSILVVAVVVICLSGCATTQSQYDTARKADTIPAYMQFLRKNPTGELSSAARKRIEELKFQEAAKKNTIAGYKSFILLSPDQQLIDEAKKRISAIQAAEEERKVRVRYEEVMQSTRISSYQAFLDDLPNSKYAPEVREALGNLLFEEARRSGSLTAWQTLLKYQPDHPASNEANKRIKEIKDQVTSQKPALDREVTNGDAVVIVSAKRISAPEDPSGVTSYVRGDGGEYVPLSAAGGENVEAQLKIVKSIGADKIRLDIKGGGGEDLHLSTIWNTRFNTFSFHIPSEYVDKDLLFAVTSNRGNPFPRIPFKLKDLSKQ